MLNCSFNNLHHPTARMVGRIMLQKFRNHQAGEDRLRAGGARERNRIINQKKGKFPLGIPKKKSPLRTNLAREP